jgi:hypothetical protein
MRLVLDCHAVADHHEAIVAWILLTGRVRIDHAAQDQRELADTLRQNDGFGLGRREFQGCIGSGYDALAIFLLNILTERTRILVRMIWLTKELLMPLRAASSS